MSGTVDCAGGDFLEVGVFGAQQVGRHQVWADGFTFIEPCDGTVPWSVTLTGFTSFLNPGRLDITVSVFSCAAICVGDSVDATVRARPTSNQPPPEPPPPPVPDNDEREGAIELEVNTGHLGQDVSSATANPTDPAECGGEPLLSDATVWFSFTAAADDQGLPARARRRRVLTGGSGDWATRRLDPLGRREPPHLSRRKKKTGVVDRGWLRYHLPAARRNRVAWAASSAG